MKTSNKIFLSTLFIVLAGFIGFLFAVRANLVIPEEVTDFGESKTIRYNDVDFETLKISANCQVELVSGAGSVVIETYENIKEYVIAEEDGKVLKIKQGTNFYSLKKPPIHVKIGIGDKLQKMELGGTCVVRSSEVLDITDIVINANGSVNVDLELNATLVNTKVQGSSNLTLKGTAKKLESRCTGSANLYAKDLATAIANVKVYGSSLTEVNADELLEVSAAGSANVRYRGNPVLKSSAKGSARVDVLE